MVQKNFKFTDDVHRDLTPVELSRLLHDYPEARRIYDESDGGQKPAQGTDEDITAQGDFVHMDGMERSIKLRPRVDKFGILDQNGQRPGHGLHTAREAREGSI